MRTWYYVTVVAEEVQALLRMKYGFEARVALEKNKKINTHFLIRKRCEDAAVCHMHINLLSEY